MHLVVTFDILLQEKSIKFVLTGRLGMKPTAMDRGREELGSGGIAFELYK